MEKSELQQLEESIGTEDPDVIQEIADECGLSFKEVQEFLRPLREM